MLFLIAILIAGAFSWFCADAIRKKPIPFYLIGTVLSVIMIVLNQAHVHFSPFMTNYVLGLFSRGALAAALWCVVAWMGALPDEARELRKKLLPARGELSIFAALITISHAVVYGISYCKRLFSGHDLQSDFVITCVICLLLMLIMIPLTVISFKAIRKKIKGKTWKAIQRAAYVFYALIYLHVMVILIPRARQGREGVLFSIVIYTIVFIGYAVCRIRKAVIKNQKPQNKAALNGVCAAVLVLITSMIGISSRAVESPAITSETPETTSAPVQTELSVTTEIPASESETISESEPESESESKSISETETESQTETAAESAAETQASETAVTETQITTEAAVTETAAPETNPPEAEQIPEENQTPEENPVQEEQPQPEEPAPEPEPEPEPEPIDNSIYNDGVYTVTKFGYDSDVIITVTIQNDVITDVSASCNESDMYYFDVAYPVLRDSILASQSPDVDAVSGSTYSSDAIRDGVREALNQARK